MRLYRRKAQAVKPPLIGGLFFWSAGAFAPRSWSAHPDRYQNKIYDFRLFPEKRLRGKPVVKRSRLFLYVEGPRGFDSSPAAPMTESSDS